MLFDKIKVEFLGTFFTTFAVGVLLIQLHLKLISLAAAAIGIFVIHTVMTWLGRPTSGAHFNSIITLCMTFSKHTKLVSGLVILGTQFVASLFAINMVKFTMPVKMSFEIQKTSMVGFPLNEDVGDVQKLLGEMVGSFFIAFCYYMLVVERTAPKNIYGPGMGGVYAATTLLLYRSSGAGLNFFRMIAYSSVSNRWAVSFIFIIGSVAGGMAGGYLGNFLLSEKAEIAKLKRQETKRKTKSKAIKKASRAK
jgi:glycerol uptake facilitator-like aquaporin